jgi:hypothetical protein
MVNVLNISKVFVNFGLSHYGFFGVLIKLSSVQGF